MESQSREGKSEKVKGREESREERTLRIIIKIYNRILDMLKRRGTNTSVSFLFSLLHTPPTFPRPTYSYRPFMQYTSTNFFIFFLCDPH